MSYMSWERRQSLNGDLLLSCLLSCERNRTDVVFSELLIVFFSCLILASKSGVFSCCSGWFQLYLSNANVNLGLCWAVRYCQINHLGWRLIMATSVDCVSGSKTNELLYITLKTLTWSQSIVSGVVGYCSCSCKRYISNGNATATLPGDPV